MVFSTRRCILRQRVRTYQTSRGGGLANSRSSWRATASDSKSRRGRESITLGLRPTAPGPDPGDLTVRVRGGSARIGRSMERVSVQDGNAGRAVLRRAHPVQGAVYAYAWQASKEQAASWAQAYLPRWAPLIQQSSLWLSEGQEERAMRHASEKRCVSYMTLPAGLLVPRMAQAPMPRGETIVRRPPQAGR